MKQHVITKVSDDKASCSCGANLSAWNRKGRDAEITRHIRRVEYRQGLRSSTLRRET